jgi:pimeloyl-ACP methyl ester carboxylesterase
VPQERPFSQRIAAAARLGVHLGPWADERTPRNVPRHERRFGSSKAYVYAPRVAPLGVYLVLPGLHFLGPDDPRLDRFCRILAASGFWVVAPFIRAYRRLLLDRSAIDDAEGAFALAVSLAKDERLPRPAVFSISFGSRLALELCALPEPPSAAVVFGGYADFIPTVRFAVTGQTTLDGQAHQLERDPLNSPVVFLNVIRHLDMTGDREVLSKAWLSMVHRTWGKMDLKRPGARNPIADSIASALPSELVVPFRLGCCLEDGFLPWLEAALARGADDLAFLDPASRIAAARCPVVLVHGQSDDVIPYVESIKLSRSLPAAMLRGLHLTGLYSHTGAASPGIGAALQETATLVRMLHDLARA